MNLISVKNLSYSYENAEHQAIKNFSLDIEQGDYVAILGTNGSGKSTLVKLIFGLLELQEGIIEIQQTGNPIGFVQQNPKYQIIASIVENDTAFGPELLKLNPSQIQERTEKSLKIVDLYEKSKDKTQSLSLGQTQKLALAGILALNPDILIFDEALSMIDPETRQNILDTAEELHAQGKTIIHITHDYDEARRASRIVVMEKGEKIFDGTQIEFENHAELKDLVYGALNSSVYKRSQRARDQAFTREGECARRARDQVAPTVPKTCDCATTIQPGCRADPLSAIDDAVVLSETRADRAPTTQPETCGIQSNATGDVAFAFENISFSYDKTTKTLENINLAFKKGSITAVLGKSGSGKSTLFEIGTSLLAPLEGKIYCSGKTSLALQDAEAALFKSVAADDVAFGPENQGLKGKELRARVKKSMDLCGLPFEKFKDRPILALSGGEKRKLAIAGIIAMDNDVIFFDEPTSSLDPKSRESFFRMIQNLADGGKTIIFSTHHKEDSLAADRTVVISNGKIIEDSAPVQFTACENADENLRYKKYASLLENLRNVTLGEYSQKKSLVHNLKPLAKIILFLVLFCASLVPTNLYALGACCVVAVIYALCAKFSLKKLCLRTLKMIPWILVFFLFQILLFKDSPQDKIYWSWSFISITDAKMFGLYKMILRFFAAMTLISVFVFSIEQTEIIDALKKFCHTNVIVFLMLLLRFIPLLTEELSHIVKTQIIREGIKSTKGFTNKVKAILPIVIPLTVQTIRRSETIAEALEARGMKG